MVAQTRLRASQIAAHMALGMAQGDRQMVPEARAWRDEWNRNNPATPIQLNMSGVLYRVRAMRQDALLRTQQTAPKAISQAVRRELSQVRQ